MKIVGLAGECDFPDVGTCQVYDDEPARWISGIRKQNRLLSRKRFDVNGGRIGLENLASGRRLKDLKLLAIRHDEGPLGAEPDLARIVVSKVESVLSLAAAPLDDVAPA
jgi:hypothetical protein